jgi:hypothetical protein
MDATDGGGVSSLARIFHPFFKARVRAAIFDFFARPDVFGGVLRLALGL